MTVLRQMMVRKEALLDAVGGAEGFSADRGRARTWATRRCPACLNGYRGDLTRQRLPRGKKFISTISSFASKEF
ncbi:MAG: hypothetical protein ACLRSW_14450 [Christensenellaceae bacterium]